MKTKVLKSPYPYYGGKSAIADEVWRRFGRVDNYIEPFMGSLAVMLRRPAELMTPSGKETCNDLNHFLTNFWRAVKADPDGVATHADWPVSEVDMHARHRFLMSSDAAAEFRVKAKADPEFFDAKFAGWWCWGMCCWIGSGWCESVDNKRPAINKAFGLGVMAKHDAGRPQLADAYAPGRGVNAGPTLKQQRPPMLVMNGVLSGSAGTCEARRAWLTQWMRDLSDRLRMVRVCCGHWDRICDSPSTMTRLGTCGVFLDPPYPLANQGKKSRETGLYAGDKSNDLDKLRDEVLAWCRKWGSVPGVRVAVCGYDTDGYAALEAEGWTVWAWKAQGGYGNRNKANTNPHRERVWFSPQCQASSRGLFDAIDESTDEGDGD